MSWNKSPLRGHNFKAALIVAAFAAGCSWGQSDLIVEANSPDDLARVAGQYGLTRLRQVRKDGGVWVVSAVPDAAPGVAAQLGIDPGVLAVELDELVHVADPDADPPAVIPASLQGYLSDNAPVDFYGTPARSGYVNQPAMSLIQLSVAETQNALGGGIVAVIDTGVDPTHPVLANSLVPGYDFVHDVAGYASELADVTQSTVAILDQSTAATLDLKNRPVPIRQSTVAILDQSTVAILDTSILPAAFGHGTMVAGLIHLVAPQAMIMPLKAFSADGTGKLSDVISAIYYATDHGANVINMSFSYRNPSPDLRRAIQYATANGVICIASVGNSGRRTTVYPAGFGGVIGVGSTTYTDARSEFSNWGEMVDVGSPGEAVITLYPGGNYAEVWGTSFSAPLVAGAASIVHTLVPNLTFSRAANGLSQGPEIMGVHHRLDLEETLEYFLRPCSAEE